MTSSNILCFKHVRSNPCTVEVIIKPPTPLYKNVISTQSRVYTSLSQIQLIFIIFLHETSFFHVQTWSPCYSSLWNADVTFVTLLCCSFSSPANNFQHVIPSLHFPNSFQFRSASISHPSFGGTLILFGLAPYSLFSRNATHEPHWSCMPAQYPTLAFRPLGTNEVWIRFMDNFEPRLKLGVGSWFCKISSSQPTISVEGAGERVRVW